VQVAIAGGHGKIALLLTRRASARGDAVRSLVREPDDVRGAGADPVLCDLEAARDDEVAAGDMPVDEAVAALGG